MYIFLTLILNSLFNKNFYNNIFLFSFLFLLVYFYSTKNIFTIYEYNLFIEDRLNIILENIMKVDYNLVLLLLLFTILSFLKDQFSCSFNILLIYIFFDLAFSYQIFYFLNLYEFKLNVKLMNGLFLIHPYCIYIFYALIITYSLNIMYYNSIKQKINYNNFMEFFLKSQVHIINSITFFGIVSIILGSWWAYQEINWAGWWSWDLIEIINLLIIMYFLNLMHRNSLEYNINYLVNFCILILFVLLLIISRFNIINSLHSFVVLSNFEQYSYIFFSYIIFTIYIIWVFYTSYLKISQIKIIYLLGTFFLLLCNIYIYRIFFELTSFIFNFNSIIEFLYFYKNINYIIFIVYSLIWVNLKFYLILFLNFFSFSEVYLVILLLSYFYNTNFNYFKFHFLFLFFIFAVYFKLNFLDFSFKLDIFSNYTTVATYKINSIYLKKTIWYINTTWSNVNTYFFDVYYIENLSNSITNYSKHCIFSLANFFLYFSSILIISNKFFYLYTYILTFFFSLYIFLFIFLNFVFIIKKKLVKNFVF